MEFHNSSPKSRIYQYYENSYPWVCKDNKIYGKTYIHGLVKARNLKLKEFTLFMETLRLKGELNLRNWVNFGTQWVKGNPFMKSHILGYENLGEIFGIGSLNKMNPSCPEERKSPLSFSVMLSVECFSE